MTGEYSQAPDVMLNTLVRLSLARKGRLVLVSHVKLLVVQLMEFLRSKPLTNKILPATVLSSASA